MTDYLARLHQPKVWKRPGDPGWLEHTLNARMCLHYPFFFFPESPSVYPLHLSLCWGARWQQEMPIEGLWRCNLELQAGERYLNPPRTNRFCICLPFNYSVRFEFRAATFSIVSQPAAERMLMISGPILNVCVCFYRSYLTYTGPLAQSIFLPVI